jgi:hypothetical protein
MKTTGSSETPVPFYKNIWRQSPEDSNIHCCENLKSYNIQKCVSLQIITNDYQFVGLEILTAVVMKSSIFWDNMPCSPLEVNQCFEGTSHSIFRVKE